MPPAASSLYPPPDPATVVGERLRKARVLAKLSVEEAAAQLNMTVGSLRSMEHGHLEPLGALVYVRGYVRNYALLVGLDPDALVRELGAPPAPELPLAADGPPPVESPGAERRRLAAYWAVAVGVGAAVVFWLLRGAVAIYDDYRAAQRWERIAIGLLLVFVSGLALSLMWTGLTRNEDGAPIAIAGDPNFVGLGEVPAIAAIPNLPEANQEQSEVTSSPPEAPAVASDLVRLRFVFSGPCWISVDDATGTRVYVALAAAGDVAEFTARGPFRVSLGNPTVARVEVNGQPFQPPNDFFLRGNGFFTIPLP